MPVKIVFDSESNGLALEADRLWIVCLKDYETQERWKFYEGDNGWQEILDSATHIIGHNIVEHDLPLFKKLTGYEPKPGILIQDTLIMSRALDYNRFGNFRHAMECWGEYFDTPKQEHEDWSQFSPEMETRCESDVELNCLMYRDLIAEFKKKYEKNEVIADYLLAEHAASKWVGMAHMNGWPFDLKAAAILEEELQAVVDKAKAELEPKLGFKATAMDKTAGEVDVKHAKWVTSGAYHSHTATYFDVNPWSGFPGEERSILGDYCRVKVEPLRLSSTDDVKIFLNRNGWVPLEYNSKFDPETKRKIQTSPKITEDSLEFLGGDGKLYREYSVAASRLSILKGWIENTDADGNLHGDCITIGTPSLRARHQVIVNVPSMDSKYGPEMRALFITKPGYKLVGCDSAGNQGRGLAYYLKDKEYTDIIVGGDIHMYNARKIDQVLTGMGYNWTEFFAKGDLKTKGHLAKFLRSKGISDYDYFMSDRKAAVKRVWKAKRGRAKRVYYAFLFGAAGPKLWGYCFNTPDAKGNQLKSGFINAVPGFANLEKRLKKEFKNTKEKLGYKFGHITGISGVPIYVDSTHKLLVYLLQAFEKATCAAAIMLLMEYLDEEQIPYIPHIFMHDEVDFSVPEEFAERAAELGVKAFTEGPKLYGVQIMSGSGLVGMNWKEIH